MKFLGFFVAAMLTGTSAQSAIIYQQTLAASGGAASFYGNLNDPALLKRGSTWIAVTGGTITSANWELEGQSRAYKWKLLFDDGEGNVDILLDGTNNFFYFGCSVTPTAPSCVDQPAFKAQLHNNIVRADFIPPRSYDNCQPFNGLFGVVCAQRYTMLTAGFGVEVAGLSDITLTIYDTRLAGAIPEPASWAMMIAGFGLTGAALRRKASLRAAARTAM